MRVRFTVVEKRTRRGRKFAARVIPQEVPPCDPEHVRDVLPRVLDEVRRRGRKG